MSEDCLPLEEVANYPGKPGNKGVSIKFKSLNALAIDASARGPGHEPRNERRVRGTGIEYYGDSSSAGESSDTGDEGSCDKQGSQREKEVSNVTKEHGRASESDVLCEGSLAKVLADVVLSSDVFESQSATKKGDQGREGGIPAGEGDEQEYNHMTTQAVWAGEQHAHAGHGTCRGQEQPGHISQMLANAGMLPAGQQGKHACDNTSGDKDAPAAKEGNTDAAMQQLSAYQGSRISDISTDIQLRGGTHMCTSADAMLQHVDKLQQIDWPTVQAGKSEGVSCVRTCIQASGADKAADTDMQHGAELQPAVDRSKAHGGGSAVLQHKTDEQHEAPAGNKEQKATAPQSPHQMASAGKGDGNGSCSQEGRPLVVATPVPKAAAGMPAADPDKLVHHEITIKAEVPQINESEMGNDKKSNNDCNIDSDSLSGEGVDGLSAFLHHANGSLLADSSSARPDSIVAAYIEEMLAKNHMLRFELAEHRRLLGECSRQLAVKIEQLTERECQLAVTEQHLAKKRREYSALAAGVEVAIQGASAKE
ncbi:g3837 [Coccomyxa elongata]